MHLAYRLGWSLCRLLFATYFRCQVRHADRVPRRGQVILAANHASYLDPPLVGASLQREIAYLARDSLFRLPGIGLLLRLWNVVPVNREGGGGAGLKAILDRLLEGQAVVVFPEGTRSHDGRLQPARSGIGLIVVKSGAPVVPVRLFGTFEAFGRGHPFPRPRRVAVVFGRPLAFTKFRAEAETAPRPRLKEIYREVAEGIMAAIADLE